MPVDEELGLLHSSQPESSNNRTFARTAEGLRPAVVRRPKLNHYWKIFFSGLVVFSAFVELCLGFIQTKFPSWQTAFFVSYAIWVLVSVAVLTTLSKLQPSIRRRLPVAAFFCGIGAWFLNSKNFEASLILKLAPLYFSAITIGTVSTPSKILADLARFVIRVWRCDHRWEEDLFAYLENN